MLPKVQCDECGKPISDKYLVFKHMLAELQVEFSEAHEIKPAYKYLVDNDTKSDMDKMAEKVKHILDALNLQLECCRVRMISCIEFNSVY